MKVAELILYEDNHLLVLNKPGGLLTQGDRTGDPTLLSWAKEYLKVKYKKPGRVFLGLVHRLDRVTSGVVILARTSKAAARLSAAFRERRVKKGYLALVHGAVSPAQGFFEDSIAWKAAQRKAFLDPRGRQARLYFQVLEKRKSESLLFLAPESGRKHQIRVQLAARGHPIVGDWKYGSRRKIREGRAILLHAWWIDFPHPTRKERLHLWAPLPYYWPHNLKLKPPTFEFFP